MMPPKKTQNKTQLQQRHNTHATHTQYKTTATINLDEHATFVQKSLPFECKKSKTTQQ